MNQNDIQIGGTHYKIKYQHWDFITDCYMPYLLGCATKYITRWKNKNGLEDLRKSIHYIEKAKERLLLYVRCDITHPKEVMMFASQFPVMEEQIIMLICSSEYDAAIKKIEELIKENS